jgi:hypothetical protein
MASMVLRLLAFGFYKSSRLDRWNHRLNRRHWPKVLNRQRLRLRNVSFVALSFLLLWLIRVATRQLQQLQRCVGGTLSASAWGRNGITQLTPAISLQSMCDMYPHTDTTTQTRHSETL